MMPPARRKYFLAVLLVILAFNRVDTQALGLVFQSIKSELHLSDTQLGVLSGIAFALFYSVMGIPIARWADRGNRVAIIAITTALWSVAVMLCATAKTFLQLLLIRIGVATGEAGCIPPAHSLIADYFTRAERPRAVAIYMLGAYLSVIIGYFFAGWLNEIYGWRVMFVLLGAPGVLLAIVAACTLYEPRTWHAVEDTAHRDQRRTVPTAEARTPRESSAPPLSLAQNSSSSAPDPEEAAPTLQTVFRTLGSNKTFRHLLLSFCVVFFFGAGFEQWQPAFFLRSYGLKTGEVGTWFAVIYGTGGFLGTYLGGVWASRYAANNERLQLQAIAMTYSALAVVSFAIYLSPALYLSFALMGLAALGPAMASGPLFATIQTLVPERMRAMSIALIYLFANLIGTGLGPLLVGALSDALHGVAGEESLRYALLAMCPGYLWGAWLLWRASQTVTLDLAHADSKLLN